MFFCVPNLLLSANNWDLFNILAQIPVTFSSQKNSIVNRKGFLTYGQIPFLFWIISSRTWKSSHLCFQVGVIGLSRRFARVVDQLIKIGVAYLRRHLEIVIGPLQQMLNGLLVQFAPDDLTAFLLWARDNCWSSTLIDWESELCLWSPSTYKAIWRKYHAIETQEPNLYFKPETEN